MQNIQKKSFSFWKETFIECMALEAFILEVMRTLKEKQKNKGKCLCSCSGMSAWAQIILMVNTGKNLCGVPETEEQISSASKQRQFQNKVKQCWADSKKPWQNLWSISVHLYDNPTEGIDKCESFFPGYEVKQSRPSPRLSFSPINPNNTQEID